jgi:hypothetical protein
MNRHEQRVLRDIERSLAVEDPWLAELLGSLEVRSRAARGVQGLLDPLAVAFLLLGLVLGDGLVLLTAALLAVLGRVRVGAFRRDQFGGDQRR